MSPIKSISIPQPCSQSWQQMDINDQGRYCLQCAKTVIDFSKMTNDEILDFLAGAKNVCGRFDENQLWDVNYQLKIQNAPKSSKWKKWVVTVGLLFGGFVTRSNAQVAAPNTIARQQPVSQIPLLGKIVLPKAHKKHRRKKTKQLTATNNIYPDNAKLIIYRSDVSVVKPIDGQSTLSAPSFNISTALQGRVGGVVVLSEDIETPSRVLMFYQYMPWPINRLFK